MSICTIRDGRIVALGSSAHIKRLAGRDTRVVDFAGHTVIPGLIDSHMHAIRAALSYSTEVHWFGNPVYVQWMYGWARLTPAAYKALNLNAESDLPGLARLLPHE